MSVVIAILVGLYLVYVTLFAIAQRHLLYPGRHRAAETKLPRDAERLPVTIQIGSRSVQLEVWLFLPARARGPVPALLFAHGNAELIDDWSDSVRPVVARGVAVALVEYPGFGHSEGTPSQPAIAAGMIAAYDALAEHAAVDPKRIVGWGRSLGTGAVCTLVGKRPLCAIILQSAFTSIRAFAPRYGIPPFLARDPFDNVRAAAAYDGPMLIVHGVQDDLVPFAHGRRLHEVACQSRFVEYEAGHNDCPPDWKAFVAEIGAFLVEHEIVDRW